MAALSCLVSAGLLYRGHHGYQLLSSGDREAISACVETRSLDCDPTGYRRALGAGALSGVTGLALFAVAWRLGRAAASDRRGG